ncbi:hypothetical protein H6G20_11935 [Desertifilum sp. FACHB-1129]|uniref:Yip1 domain-containing protein n=1 Tax=Desertifilum tharense IPPAS B-1220 TaxID=1781255 RepID=A0A1E5QN65_9CYAN|nr:MULTISPECIES: hypothetical protein [Desertifilum]MDA0213063.1 hypothetical protein [Cyanobacteria bacterium FC1]MBD2312371.1 hypothetical protein [Desertifilum sp. FACHB-1129]MBD2321154.1 hypothetical protein [Desertifilum sp. FACHB-866]MBD2331539.1 hypothetical protein [Desertifilum sp. FACHB-868]OEJ76051.1 hypothetical protein BH720_05695 [Desertifilum tharense IPPAS B-1220]
MTETAIDRLGEILWGAIALQSNAFQLIDTLPLSSRLAFLIVLLAGLSQAIGQGIILFMNRVKPSRFILSLFLAAILYAFGYIFWGLSTWLVCYLFFEQNASVFSVARVLGLAYAPELFSILIALPYLGVPISIILSIWTFLGFLTGMNAVLEMGMWPAFWSAVLGWVVVQILQRTIGRPVKALGQWLANYVAGVELIADLKEIEKVLELGVPTKTIPPNDPPNK